MRFLGGLNLALAVLSVATLAMLRKTPVAFLVGPFLTFATAHLSQFAVNLPLALRERRGQPTAWPVLKGLMRLIFVVDGVLAGLNVVQFFVVVSR